MLDLIHCNIPSDLSGVIWTYEREPNVNRCGFWKRVPLSPFLQLRSIQDLQTVQIIKILRYEKKVAVMFFLMISCFLLCWTPYAIVSMVEAFGRQSMVSPTVAIIPSFFAKSSTAYNPLIYVFMSRKVSCFGAQIEKCISKLCSKALDFGACFISILLMDAALAKTSLLSLQFHFQLS